MHCPNGFTAANSLLALGLVRAIKKTQNHRIRKDIKSGHSKFSIFKFQDRVWVTTLWKIMFFPLCFPWWSIKSGLFSKWQEPDSDLMKLHHHWFQMVKLEKWILVLSLSITNKVSKLFPAAVCPLDVQSVLTILQTLVHKWKGLRWLIKNWDQIIGW